MTLCGNLRDILRDILYNVVGIIGTLQLFSISRRRIYFVSYSNSGILSEKLRSPGARFISDGLVGREASTHTYGPGLFGWVGGTY